MKALILANGELNKPDVLRKRIQAEKFDLICAADAGARHAETLNVTLDAIIGDMDSLSDLKPGISSRTKLISYPVEKNEIDLELALLYAAQQGADRIVIAGLMGGRMDMTLANILLLTHAGLSSCRIEIWHEEQTGWIIKPPGEDIHGQQGDTVSLIPLASRVSGVTNTGFKYPLRNETLMPGKTRGISNLLEKTRGHIEFSEGTLLVIHTPAKYSEMKRGWE